MVGRFVALPVKSIGQGDVLDVFRQIGLDIKIHRHCPAFIGFQKLLCKTETFGFNKIKTGLGRGHIVSGLTGDGLAGRVHSQVQRCAGDAQVVFSDFFLGLKYPGQR